MSAVASRRGRCHEKIGVEKLATSEYGTQRFTSIGREEKMDNSRKMPGKLMPSRQFCYPCTATETMAGG
jgi:hypothetical protein